MKFIFDFDGVLTDFNRFIQENAIGYFQKKYHMPVVNPDALEIEDIFDIQNTLKKAGYSAQEADNIRKRMLDRFWISYRFIKFSLLNRFRPSVKRYINDLNKMGVIVEIHSSRAKTCDGNLIGRIARAFTIWQCRLNGVFLRKKQFFFYPNDEEKLEGILKACPTVAFDDKQWIVEHLAEQGMKVICVSSLHNKSILPSKNVEVIYKFDKCDIERKIERLLGKANYVCQKREVSSAKFFKRLLKISVFLRLMFRPMVLHPENIISGKKEGIVYAPNHRSTLDPIIIESVLMEHIHWAALARFFKGEDSIFNNSKNPVLCNITQYAFRKLEYFPIERKCDDQKADNMASLKDMDLFLRNGYKIGIFAEGTTKRDIGQDFGTFDDSFLRLAKRNNAWIQPVTLFWTNSSAAKTKVIVNIGKAFQVTDLDMGERMKHFLECQRTGLEENMRVANRMKI